MARSLGERGAVVSGDGVRPSAEGGRRRRESREWRGGRMSNNCGGGSVDGVGGVVAVGMVGSVRVVVVVVVEGTQMFGPNQYQLLALCLMSPFLLLLLLLLPFSKHLAPE